MNECKHKLEVGHEYTECFAYVITDSVNINLFTHLWRKMMLLMFSSLLFGIFSAVWASLLFLFISSLLQSRARNTAFSLEVTVLNLFNIFSFFVFVAVTGHNQWFVKYYGCFQTILIWPYMTSVTVWILQTHWWIYPCNTPLRWYCSHFTGEKLRHRNKLFRFAQGLWWG